MLETLFSSRVRAKLLTALFLSPGIERNAWELSQSLQEHYSAVWKELNKLEKLGILKSEQKGNSKAYQVNPACPLAPELRSMILKTEGIGGLIRKRLNQLKKVKEAYIFGSFASGEADQHSDFDIMIIGDIDLEALAPLVAEAEKELNRPINYIIYSEGEWNEKLTQEDPFAVNVTRSPKIMLVGDGYAL